ncbi:hypothetical protein KUV56_08265 [Ferrimonas balearica]|uniref:hypothetical protein n=1 Tax=Ferrimonas balearica TaxID=44012 RepID=UPI001C591B6F|nr:hypothetical protein [Ferrimonas balearica]MBW3139507.1 hypothetical protein [Ferrimonas balearica]
MLNLDNPVTEIAKRSVVLGVVCIILLAVLNLVFTESIISLFGSEKMFLLLSFVLVSMIVLTYIIAIRGDTNAVSNGDEEFSNEESIFGAEHSEDNRADSNSGMCNSKDEPSLGDSAKVIYKDNARHNGDNHF